MTAALHNLATLIAKDLRIEARGRQTIGLVLVLGVLIVVVLGLGLGPQQLASSQVAPAVLWVAYLFAGVLCFEKTMAIDRHDGALAALMLSPVDRGLIYLAKLLSNLILILLICAVITPVAVLLFGFDLSAAPGQFALVMLLSLIGFAAVGTLFSFAFSSTRLQGGLLAMAIFPITLPLIIASTQMLGRLFREGQSITGGAMLVLVAFAVVYLVVSWIVFELVLEP